MSSQRIDAFLAERGLCARRKAQGFLHDNIVTQMEHRITASGERIDSAKPVYCNGQVIKVIENYYIALNKPIRYLCSNEDKEERDLAISLIPLAKSVRLHNVGRLDYFSQGLILFTNDGDFTKRVTHPSFEVEKEYILDLERSLTKNEMGKIQKGLRIDAILYTVKAIEFLGGTKYSIVLQEGKNREIRRIFHYFNIKINHLNRIRIGSILLKDMAIGQYRHLTESEIRSFMD
ncbi:pseudouridine synthase [Entomospira entomophila]|uniref:Pseudouridine synthase n=1 Tax=Entomospira entomophila TaxID=2719988 RepID=A0A968G9W0_9SPIO|nr:pseudouridine synthase [Entomospira entomophilus]NIZ41202.1 rRNA pseudouridine synthase [Entomospira entomophilus]WDI35408.1 pseudouridine synthase [Entomospira entomophilus]